MPTPRSFMRWLTVVFTVTMALAWVPAAWAAAPALLILSPSSADSGGPAFTLTIVGMNFTSESTAMWGATVLTTTYISDTELSADVPASLIVSTGAASITVTTAGGVSSGISFTINPPSPSISGQRPALAVVNETTVSASLVTVAPAATVPVATAIGITSQSAFDANPPSPSIPDPKPASAVVDEAGPREDIQQPPPLAAQLPPVEQVLWVDPPTPGVGRTQQFWFCGRQQVCVQPVGPLGPAGPSG